MAETNPHIMLLGWLAVIVLGLFGLELVTRNLESLIRAIKALIKAWKEPG